jgi:type II secretory pathway component PulC
MNVRAAILAFARGVRAATLATGALMLAGTLSVRSAEDAPAPRPRLALFGTVIGNGNAVAMFNDQSTGGTVSLRVGDVYEGWRVRSIETGSVTFENKGQRANYALAERAPGQLQLPYVPPAATRVPAGAPMPADKSRSQPANAAGTSPQGDPPAKTNRPAEEDPVAEWFRRQRR